MSGFLAGVLAREIGNTAAEKGLLPRFPSRFETPAGPEPFGASDLTGGLPSEGSSGGEMDASPAGFGLSEGPAARDDGGGDYLTGAARLPGTGSIGWQLHEVGGSIGWQLHEVGDARSLEPHAPVPNRLGAEHDTRQRPSPRVPGGGGADSEPAPLAANIAAGTLQARQDSDEDEILNRGAMVPAESGAAPHGVRGWPTSELAHRNPGASPGPGVVVDPEAPPPGEEIRPRLGALQPPEDGASKAEGTVIHVSIGRIEIRAVPARDSAADSKPATRAQAKPMSLDEYLERRGKGGAR